MTKPPPKKLPTITSAENENYFQNVLIVVGIIEYNNCILIQYSEQHSLCSHWLFIIRKREIYRARSRE
jgi:hypothetical protein